jgi:BMFP domain-containing protein YqiC
MVGCGPKPPCDGADVTAVQVAQDESDAALTELDTARSERAELEADVARTRSDIADLEGQPAALEARLYELKKGSGR